MRSIERELLPVMCTFVLACGGNAFDSRGAGVGSEDDGGKSDAAAASGGGDDATGGASTAGGRNGGAPNGGRGQAGAPGGAPPEGGASQGGTSSLGGATSIGGSTAMRASNFDQTCSFDGECSLVTEGDPCGCLGCVNAAVASYELPKWNEILSSTRCTGPAQPCPPIACEQMLAACSDGTCGARSPLYVDPSKYDTACRADTDCKVIQGGEVCSSCRCGGTGVSLSGYAAYQKDISGVSCNAGPSVCDCATFDVAHCEKDGSSELGKCVAGFTL